MAASSSAQNGVVIWEWMNQFGIWRPYGPEVADFLEKNKQSSVPIPLGAVDRLLTAYTVDFHSLCQIRNDTGTARPIRRMVFPMSSPMAKGVAWQWAGNTINDWHSYSIEVACVIEDGYSNGLTFLDLSKSVVAQPYHIDLQNMTQKRIETGNVRMIRREKLNSQYPLVSGLVHTQISDIQQNSCVSPHNRQVNAPVPNSFSSSFSGSRKRKRPGDSIQNVTAHQSPSISHTSQQPGGNLTSGSGFINQSTPPSQIFASSSVPLTTPMVQGPLTRNRYSTVLANLHQQFGPTSSSALPGGQQPITSSLNQQFGPTSSSLLPGGQQSNSSYSQTGPPLLVSPLTGLGPSSTSIPFHLSGHINASNNSAFYGAQQQSHSVSVNHGNPPVFPTMYPNVSLLGNSYGNMLPGISPHLSIGMQVPSQLFGKSSHGHRISPVVTSMTNMLMSPAVPVLVSSPHTPGSTASVVQSLDHSDLPKWNRITNNAPKASKKNSHAKNGTDILMKYVKLVASPPEEEDCCICFERLCQSSGYGSGGPDDSTVIQLLKCAHMFHKLCLVAMYNSGAKDGSIQCPTCKQIYGEKSGNCPRGEMAYQTIPRSLPSHTDCQTIRILYHISPGMQGLEHPHPGKKYTTRGFPRIGYLPDDNRGRKVLQLLIVAWKRRLTFTIGMSTTTGEADTVTWNEIHHKTEFGSNYSGHGYPDPNYMDNVEAELALQGVTDQDL